MTPTDRDDDLHENVLPVVPYVPFRCPACARHKPFTGNVRGRLRTHVCQACGTKYRSLEVDASAVSGFAAKHVGDS